MKNCSTTRVVQLLLVVWSVALTNGVLTAQDVGVGHLENDHIPDSVMEKLVQEGYKAELSAVGDKFARLQLEKEGFSEKEHGLLGIRWKERETWDLLYLREPEGGYRFVEGDGSRSTKAPFLGRWREIEQRDTVPKKFTELLGGDRQDVQEHAQGENDED